MGKSTFIKKITSMAVVTTGAGVFFAGLNIRKGNATFYENFLMPVVRFIPPETSHNLAVFLCKYNIFPAQTAKDSNLLATTFLGRKLENPIGIAAGFDKHGEAVEGLHRIGFGFIEIGSITPLPQDGNPKPRVFRLPNDKAIINRYGFNSEGHEVVYNRVKTIRENGNFQGFLGINLGKNKTSENALEDYVKGVKLFAPIADYLVINISSPNTPGLRSLQSKDDLKNMLSGVLKARDDLALEDKIPVLLKLAPDLEKQEICDIAKVVKSKGCRVDGLIISNTTIDKSNLKETELAQETGGLSGAPLSLKSTKLIAEMYYLTGGSVPIVGVGGVFTGADAFEKIQAGASVIQLYTSFAYHGPPIVNKIKVELDEILKSKGYKNISDAVGKNYKQYLK